MQSTTGQHAAPLRTVTHADGDGGATHLDTALKGRPGAGSLLNNCCREDFFYESI